MAGSAPRTPSSDSSLSQADASVAAAPIKLTDRYLLCGKLGSGGMAQVHVGRMLGSAAFTRTVAIKRLHARYAREDEFRLMLTDEARLAARVRHPNVVQMLDVVSTDEELFLVMEYIDGASLRRLNERAKAEGARIPEPILVSIMCQVLHGLHAAHEATDEQGSPLCIVHRDVSPDNVLVGVEGLARVLDFGIAKATSRLISTRDGQIKGKLSYMAPEQLSGRATRQSDVFSASIVLWEGLVGQRLFRADDDGETIGRVLAAVVPPPVSVVPEVHPRLSDIVLKGLARDPAQRWATARDMALALEREVPMATPSQVGAWIESLDGAWLASRRELVHRVEALPVDGAPAAELSPASMPVAWQLDEAPAPRANDPEATTRVEDGPPPRRRVGAYVVAVAALAAGATVVAWAARSRTVPAAATASTESAIAASVTPPSAAPAAAPSVTASAPEPTTEPVPEAVASASSAASKAAPAHAPRRVAAPASAGERSRPVEKSATNRCDPPYRLGPMGEKIWLKSCL